MSTTTKSTAFLNKSEATHYMHKMHELIIKARGLPNNHPDFYSLINENIRNPNSPSATIAGHPRGNKSKYGLIEHIRIKGRPMFSRQHLKEWFLKYYYPEMLKQAT